MRVALYARVSTERQQERGTVSSQLEALRAAADDITAAVADGAYGVGEDHGLPLHHFPLEQTAQAHAAVEDGTVGKVLIDVAE